MVIFFDGQKRRLLSNRELGARRKKFCKVQPIVRFSHISTEP